MISVQELRKYRFQLPSHENQEGLINNTGEGIAFFDFLLTFVAAYLLEPYLLPFLKQYNFSRKAYYLMLIPLGVIVHILTKQDTFLNKRLFNKEVNLYKVCVFFIIYYLVKELKLV